MSDLIQATSKNVRTLVDGTLRLTVDISPHQALSAFQLFGMPDAPVVLARLMPGAALEHAQNEMIEEDAKEAKGGFLSQWLAMRCNEVDFQVFVVKFLFNSQISIRNSQECDAAVKDYLEIQSKKIIDIDKNVEAKFHQTIRLPYAKWLAGVR